MSSPDTTVSEAAISALGKIGTAEAVEVLRREREKASGSRRGSICEALLNCADQLRVQGETDRALAVYRMLTSPSDPVPARRAAFRGTILADSKNATALMKQVLSSSDATMHPMVMQLIGEVPTIDEVRTIAEMLPEFPAESQVQMLAALARFRDVEVQKIVVSATGSKDPQIRTSALRTLGSMGSSTVVPLLAKVAATARGTEQTKHEEAVRALWTGCRCIR